MSRYPKLGLLEIGLQFSKLSRHGAQGLHGLSPARIPLTAGSQQRKIKHLESRSNKAYGEIMSSMPALVMVQGSRVTGLSERD